MSQSPNPYDLLKLAKNANDDEIRVAYRKAVKIAHPDKHRNNPAANERVKLLTEAKNTLLDPLKRARVDNPGVPIQSPIPDFRVDVKLKIEQAYCGDTIQVEYAPDLYHRTASGITPVGKLDKETLTLEIDGNAVGGGLKFIPDAPGSKLANLGGRGNVAVFYVYNPSALYKRVKDDLVVTVACSLIDVIQPTLFQVPLPSKGQQQFVYVRYDPEIDVPITTETNVRYVPGLGFKTSDGTGQLVIRFIVTWPYPFPTDINTIDRLHEGLSDDDNGLAMYTETTVIEKPKEKPSMKNPQCTQM